MKSVKGYLQVILGVLSLAIAAQIAFNFSYSSINIPVTGQTLGVVLVAYFCTEFYGIFSVLIYLILGGLGLPIFAQGASGWEKFSGGSGGFLIGFLMASILVALIKKYYKEKTLKVIALVNILGTTVILICGVTWLTYLFGLTKALEYGFYPFWIGAIAKVIIGVLIILVIHEIVSKKVNL